MKKNKTTIKTTLNGRVKTDDDGRLYIDCGAFVICDDIDSVERARAKERKRQNKKGAQR